MRAVYLNDNNSLARSLFSKDKEQNWFILGKIVADLDDASHLVYVKARHTDKLWSHSVIISSRKSLVVVFGKLLPNIQRVQALNSGLAAGQKRQELL